MTLLICSLESIVTTMVLMIDKLKEGTIPMTANEIVEVLESEKKKVSAEHKNVIKAYDYAILSVRAVHEMYLTGEKEVDG